jgi:uncharacterized protein (DUF2267 family)
MTISHDEFVNTVAERGDLETQQQARYAARATLVTLSERISHGAAEDIAETLPTGIRDAVVTDESEDPESFSPDAFVQRVEDREREYPELNMEHTRRHVEAVLTTLRDEATEPFEAAISQLPNEYERLYQLPP